MKTSFVIVQIILSSICATNAKNLLIGRDDPSNPTEPFPESLTSPVPGDPSQAPPTPTMSTDTVPPPPTDTVLPDVALLTPSDTITCGQLHLTWLYSGPDANVTVYAINYTDPRAGIRPVIVPVVVAESIPLSLSSFDWAPVRLSPGQYTIEMDGTGFNSLTSPFAVGLGVDDSCLLSTPPQTIPATWTPATPSAPASQTQAPISSPSLSTVPIGGASSSNNSSTTTTTVSTGVIVGSVLGGLAALAFLVLAVIIWRRMRHPGGARGYGQRPSTKWGNLGSLDAHGAPYVSPPAALIPANRHRQLDSDSRGAIMRSGGAMMGIDSDADSIDEEKYWASSPNMHVGDSVSPLPFRSVNSSAHYGKAVRQSSNSLQSTSRNSRGSVGSPYEQQSPRRSDEESNSAGGRTGRRKPVPQYSSSDTFVPDPVELPSRPGLMTRGSHPDLHHQSSFTFDKPVHYIMPDPPQSRS